MTDLDDLLDQLGIQVRYRSGQELWASCPLPTHKGVDSNPSFSINETKGVFFCFACGEGGSLDRLAETILGIDHANTLKRPEDDFVEKIDAYLEREPTRIREQPILPWFSHAIIPAPVTSLPLDKHISPETCKRLRLSFDPARHRGSYCGPAVIIPHIFKQQLVGWQERWLDAERPSYIPKYTMSAEFPKKFTLYNYDNCVDSQEPVFVVEGALTVAVLESHGFPALATFGASVSDRQIDLLRGFLNGLVLSYDNDSAGQEALARLEMKLERYIPLWVIPPPERVKGDLGDLPSEKLLGHIHRIL